MRCLYTLAGAMAGGMGKLFERQVADTVQQLYESIFVKRCPDRPELALR